MTLLFAGIQIYKFYKTQALKKKLIKSQSQQKDKKKKCQILVKFLC